MTTSWGYVETIADGVDGARLTAALLVVLTQEGLQIPALDGVVGGQQKHAALPLDAARLTLLSVMARGAPSADAAITEVCGIGVGDAAGLREFVAALTTRGLLRDGRPAPESDVKGAAADIEYPVVDAAGDMPLVVATPRMFRIGAGGFEFFDAGGRRVLVMSSAELAAASEFRQPVSPIEAFDGHGRSAGPLAIDADRFEHLIRRLLRCALLQPVAAADVMAHTGSAWDPLIKRGRNIARERFGALNDSIREGVISAEREEQERRTATGKKRVRVVSVQQNGTIFPLALGMIVAAAKTYEGGRLNEDYQFHPDWLVRPSKVRALTREPAVFLFSNSATFSAISTSRGKMPKFASAHMTPSTRCVAHHSSSANTRSSENLRILVAIADPQSQNVQA